MLSDGGAALSDAATREVGTECSEDRERVDSFVGIEVGILGSDGSESDKVRNIVVSDHYAVFFIVESVEFDGASFVVKY